MRPANLSHLLAGRKLAVITGASRGIGAACKTKFIAEGYSVLGLDLTEPKQSESWNLSADESRTPSAIQDDGIPGTIAGCDVSDASQVRTIAEEIAQTGLSVDAIVNVAGISPPGNILEGTDEDWDRTFSVNVGGIRNVTRAFAPLFGREASIVNVSSGAGLRAIPGLAAYVASKHAVVGLTRAMAIDFAERGIRVNCVCPGQVNTDLARQVQDERTGESKDRAATLSDYLIPRIGQPSEIAESIFFLASAGASYITGSTLSVDAGRTQH